MSALPTQPAHGLPVACPVPDPLRDGDPLRVDVYWLADALVSLAPLLVLSAVEYGCGVLTEPDVPAVPCCEWLDAVLEACVVLDVLPLPLLA